MANETALVIISSLLASSIGVWVGMWSANRKWTTRGADGFPRIEFGGRLYWVNRDDAPCFRCGGRWDEHGD